MTAVVPFAFDDQLVRAVPIGSDSWFVGNDVCRALALKNPRSSLALLDDDEKGVHTVDTPGGAQEVAIVSEPGVYRLIFTSRKAEAERFKRWLAHDVLPALRRSGRYEAGAVPEVSATVGALREREHNLERVKTAHRLWGPAAARCLWVEVGEPDYRPFLAEEARRLSASPAARLVAAAIVALVERPAYFAGWEGTASELMEVLAEGEGVEDRAWPTTAQKLGNALRDVNPLLVSHGIRVDRRHSQVRRVSIVTGLPLP